MPTLVYIQRALFIADLLHVWGGEQPKSGADYHLVSMHPQKFGSVVFSKKGPSRGRVGAFLTENHRFGFSPPSQGPNSAPTRPLLGPNSALSYRKPSCEPDLRPCCKNATEPIAMPSLSVEFRDDPKSIFSAFPPKHRSKDRTLFDGN